MVLVHVTDPLDKDSVSSDITGFEDVDDCVGVSLFGRGDLVRDRIGELPKLANFFPKMLGSR